mmetsp:Transcript_17274/g.51813  ORF Transcript_17274/g.51813 Transcript_17274/m.51813 type:complete len:684 (-) Transcript_17274:25-2076(-)
MDPTAACETGAYAPVACVVGGGPDEARAAKQTEPLVAKDVEGGGGSRTWPAKQPLPVAERSRNLHLKCVLCAAPLAIVAYALGAAAVVLAAVLALLVWLLGGLCACGTHCWLRSWGWAGNHYLRVIYLFYQEQLFQIRKRPETEAMPVSGLAPAPAGGLLEKQAVQHVAGIEVPRGSEEEFGKGGRSPFSDWVEASLAKYLPFDMDMSEFADGEDPVRYVMDRVGTIYPVLYQEWADKQSDEALTRFAVNGLGAHRLDVEVVDGYRYFVVRGNQLASLPVQDGYERYGGDCYFDRNWRPAFIKDMGLAAPRRDGPGTPVVTRPGEPGWGRAKFRFRSTLSVLVTFVDHLFGIHLEASNLVVTSMRENLPAHHPFRRFLAPFTYMAISVNDNAHHNLMQPGSMVDRCFAFTRVAVQKGFAGAKDLIHYGVAGEVGPFLNKEKWYDYMRSKGIDTAYLRFSAKYWRIIRDFVEAYADYYYESAEEMAADLELVKFTRQVTHQSIIATPSAPRTPYTKLLGVSRTHDKIYGGSGHGRDVLEAHVFKEATLDLLAAYIWQVTAGHEQVGSVGVYVQDASFCAFKWTPGSCLGTKQGALAQALLMSFTSTPMPCLLGADWTHLFPARRGPAMDGRASPGDAFASFQAGLEALSEEVGRHNAECHARPFPECFPIYVVDPKVLETSVSV